MTLDALVIQDIDERHGLDGAPVFFMHIAKTAGSYLNDVLANAMPPGQVVVHVEHKLGNSDDLRAMLEKGARIISGHVMNGLWEDVAAPLGMPFRKVTILREPIAHLASHLLWLDHYNRPEMRGGYRALDEAHQRIVDRVGAVDLSDIGQLDQYLTNLGATETRLFDNCQSRYFLAHARRDLEACRALSLADARRVRHAAGQFETILTQDRLEQGIIELGVRLELPLKPLGYKVNAAKSERAIDIENPLVRQVLSKRLLLDQWLWRWVNER